MAGEASVLNEPIHFGLEVFSGNQAGEAMEWELTVGFDVFGFCQDNLQEVEFLSLDRRRFLQGVMVGFGEKLTEQAERSRAEGLVWVGDGDLQTYAERRHPHMGGAARPR